MALVDDGRCATGSRRAVCFRNQKRPTARSRRPRVPSPR